MNYYDYKSLNEISHTSIKREDIICIETIPQKFSADVIYRLWFWNKKE